MSAIGWEFAAAYAVPASLLGGFTGIAAVRLARRRAEWTHPLVLWVQAALACGLALLFPILVGFLHGLRRGIKHGAI